MNERVRPDYSVKMDAGQYGDYLLDPRYDFIRVFPWIKHAVINILTETGVARLHVQEEEARRVRLQSQIPLVELEWITEQEYESYLAIQGDADNLEGWLED